VDVGVTGLQTCALVAGDVRVTSAAGHSFDGVQKVHLITPSAAAGFSGSVRFGLRSVEDLKRHAAAELTRRGLSDFRAGIEGWGRRVRHAWNRDQDATTGMDLHLLILTAWRRAVSREVNELLGVTLAETTGFILKSPDFAVERVARPVVAIGSGGGYASLNAQLESIEQEVDGLNHFELELGFAAIGGAAAPFAAVLSDVIRAEDPKDVSDHLHVCLVKPGGSKVVTFDMAGLTPGAPTRTMPDVATNESEWDRIAARHHLADAVA
jgi:hypothetical protein